MTQDSIENLDTEEIDNYIKSTANIRKTYSKTYAEQSYTPLSESEKIKFLQDDLTSNKRLLLYSQLFNEIKNQISSINVNLNKEIGHHKKTSHSISITNSALKSVKKCFNYNSFNFAGIDEEDDNDINEDTEGNINLKQKSKKSLADSKKNEDIENIYSCDEFDEKPHVITFPYTIYRTNILEGDDFMNGLGDD